MPEALLGGYPKGADFGARVGYRTPEGRDAFLKYWREAIEVPGPQTEALGELARNTGAALVVGVIERNTTTLYCTALFFSSRAVELVGKHRKLVPTAMERLIWGQGDGSTLYAMQTACGPHRRSDLLGELHAAAAHGNVCEGSRHLVRTDCR